MRLARTIWDETKAEQITTWLKARGVNMELQPYPADRPASWRIWVMDEEQLEPVRGWIDEIESGKIELAQAMQSLPQAIPLEIESEPLLTDPELKTPKKPTPQAWLTQSLVILLVVIHLALNLLTSPATSDLWESRLLIDDPTQYPSTQSANTATNTTWPGLYSIGLMKLHPPPSTAPSETPSRPETHWTFLGCVQHGQIWRLITPVLMHGEWLHLLFNVMWLSILGIAIEPRLGSKRLAILMLSAGLVSNLAQYLMSGYQFLGFSGIVMALVAFAYVRMRRFPWEGYPIAPPTFTFVGFYLILTLFLQLLSFILDALGWSSIHLGIANASHLGGLAIGWLLGSMRSMSTRQ